MSSLQTLQTPSFACRLRVLPHGFRGWLAASLLQGGPWSICCCWLWVFVDVELLFVNLGSKNFEFKVELPKFEASCLSRLRSQLVLEALEASVRALAGFRGQDELKLGPYSQEGFEELRGPRKKGLHSLDPWVDFARQDLANFEGLKDNKSKQEFRNAKQGFSWGSSRQS